MASYAEGVQIMDEYMGRVLYALEQSGLDSQTLVIITTDHGIEFPGGKKTLSDQGTQVMLLMRGQLGSGIDGGLVIEPIVTQLDIYPTICELIQKETAHKLEGSSLLPLIRGEVEQLHEVTFSEQTYHGKLEPLRAARSERYKYIRRHYSTGPQMRSDGPSCPAMESYGYFDRDIGHEELYDLYLDPWENTNRINDPSLKEIQAELSQRLDSWMASTNDMFPSSDFPRCQVDQRTCKTSNRNSAVRFSAKHSMNIFHKPLFLIMAFIVSVAGIYLTYASVPPENFLGIHSQQAATQTTQATQTTLHSLKTYSYVNYDFKSLVHILI